MVFKKKEVVLPIENGKIKLIKGADKSPKQVYLKEVEKRKNKMDDIKKNQIEQEKQNDTESLPDYQMIFETKSIDTDYSQPLTSNEIVVELIQNDDTVDLPVDSSSEGTNEASPVATDTSKFRKAADECPEGAEKLSEEQMAKLTPSTYGRCELCGAPLKKDGTHRKPRVDAGQKRGSYKKND